jgi:hypothetical protein
MMPTLQEMGYVEIQGAIPGDGFCCGWCKHNDWGRCGKFDFSVVAADIHELRGICSEWKKGEEG